MSSRLVKIFSVRGAESEFEVLMRREWSWICPVKLEQS